MSALTPREAVEVTVWELRQIVVALGGSTSGARPSIIGTLAALAIIVYLHNR